MSSSFETPWLRLLCPWDSSGKNTGGGCHFLLQGMFLTQGSNPCLLHCRQILYHLSHQESPIYGLGAIKKSLTNISEVNNCKCFLPSRCLKLLYTSHPILPWGRDRMSFHKLALVKFFCLILFIFYQIVAITETVYWYKI